MVKKDSIPTPFDTQIAALETRFAKIQNELDENIALRVDQPNQHKIHVKRVMELNAEAECIGPEISLLKKRSSAAAHETLQAELAVLIARIKEIDERMTELSEEYSTFVEIGVSKIETHGYNPFRLAREIDEMQLRAPKPVPEYYALGKEVKALMAQRDHLATTLNRHSNGRQHD